MYADGGCTDNLAATRSLITPPTFCMASASNSLPYLYRNCFLISSNSGMSTIADAQMRVDILEIKSAGHSFEWLIKCILSDSNSQFNCNISYAYKKGDGEKKVTKAKSRTYMQNNNKRIKWTYSIFIYYLPYYDYI